ncbi:cyclic-di-AMP-binding protein CbpB [Streptococcus fryi]
MIAREFETFLSVYHDSYMTPTDELAIFIDTHNTDHALLLLASNGFSRVPVMTKDRRYIGTISAADIVGYQAEHQISDDDFATMDISLMVNKRIPSILPTASLTEIMHKLVDASFLPVVTEEQHFLGIVTRKAILKSINSLLHDFKKHYDIVEKEDGSAG